MKRTQRRKSRQSIDPNTLVLIKQIVLGVLIFGFAGGLIMGVWYGTRVSWLTLTDISVDGGETIDHALVRQAIDAELSGTYLGLVPRRFAWLYPRERIVTVVRAIPRVSTVHIDRASGSELTVAFNEYVPAALWCADIATTTCAFLDKSGYAFASAPVLQGGELLRFVSLATTTPQAGSRPFSTDDIVLITHLRELLQDAGWYVSHIEIDAMRDVFIHIVGGGEFKATLTVAPEQVVANLQTVLTAPEFADIAPGNFAYIDLRFGNKIYVNEELLVATSTDDVVASSTADAPSQGDGAGDSSSLDEE